MKGDWGAAPRANVVSRWGTALSMAHAIFDRAIAKFAQRAVCATLRALASAWVCAALRGGG